MYRKAKLLLTAALVLLPGLSHALSSDRNQPIHVSADRFEADQKKGIGIYRGNVEVIQGSLHLWADVVTVYQPGDKLQKVVGDGTPARFTQRPDNAQYDIHGHSLHFEYHVPQGLVYLTGKAHVEQNRDQFDGARIVYDTAHAVVKSSGSGKGSGDGRVHAVIQPKSKQDPNVKPKPQPPEGKP